MPGMSLTTTGRRSTTCAGNLNRWSEPEIGALAPATATVAETPRPPPNLHGCSSLAAPSARSGRGFAQLHLHKRQGVRPKRCGVRIHAFNLGTVSWSHTQSSVFY